MKVTLLSAFRDSERKLDAYLKQILDLEALLGARGDELHLIWGEGDSVDNTRTVLEAWTPNELIDVSHGGKHYGSVVSAERFEQLAQVWNTLWSHIPQDSDVVIFVESDLIWKPEDMLTLIDQTADYPVLCGMVWHRIPATGFYDTLAYRKDGKHFTYRKPFHPAVTDGMVQLDSAGSCLVMRGELAGQLTWPKKDVVVGVCKQVYERGGEIWLNSAIHIYHP